jgi:hypothetical protein
MTPERRANRLAAETSPYLKQHARNPVDWYPWGEEALGRARAEDKPIFLSIGYSACHWCHVMEHESFENDGIAAAMNESFVNIKVDREERPDLDDIYMAATQLLTGQGGWPNSVFLTPELKPFFAGTYFPPEPRYGRPGFPDILKAVAEAYRTRRHDVAKIAEEVAGQIRKMSEASPSRQVLSVSTLNRAFGEMATRFDNEHGGFGRAPKFPPSTGLMFLLRYHRRTGNPEALRMAVVTLDAMARGGMHDHLGGGFHRYAVDERWLVPHFEKMLYDNALLARVYLEAAQAVAGLPASSALPAGGAATAASFRDVARDALDWVLREMTSPEGGFYSSLDADSEREEGKFYVWTPEEVEAVLGRQEAALLCGVYGIVPGGNYEGGRSIPHLEASLAGVAASLAIDPAELWLRLAGARAKLLAARGRRVAPGRDDKILTDWNALMIGTLALAARALDETRYLEAAARAARFILDRMRRPAAAGGRLLHSFKDGDARHAACLTDYAYLVGALLDLYEADFDAAWVKEARALTAAMIDLFWDDEAGFYFTGRDHEQLIARTRENGDGATPAGVSVAAMALQRLAWLAGDEGLAKKSAHVLRLYRDGIERFPSAFGMMLCALDQHLGRQRQIVVAGRRDEPGVRAAIRTLRAQFDPNRITALADPGDRAAADTMPLLAGKVASESGTAIYVCEDGACRAPVASAADIPA